VTSRTRIEAAPVSEPELKLARQLIDHLGAKRFDANEYVDEHRARVEAAIQRKVDGKEVSLAEVLCPTRRQRHRLDGGLRASIDARGSKTPILRNARRQNVQQPKHFAQKPARR